MEDSARHLMFHAVVLLLAGILAGVPYGKAILKKRDERLVTAWRVAHIALIIGAILLLVLAVSFSGLNVAESIKWIIAVLFIISGYGFMLALLLGPIVGYRGLTAKGPIAAKVVYFGNILGSTTSSLATLVLLYAAWLNL